MIWLIPLFFVVLVLWRNIWMYQNFCQPTFDIGIFVDFVQRIAHGDLNPYSTVRQIAQYVDHFTPVLLMVGAFGQLIPQPYLLFIVEVAFIAFVAGVLWYAKVKGITSSAATVFAIGLAFLNRDMFETGFFPVHPAVWAMPFLISMALFAQKDLVLRGHDISASSLRWMILLWLLISATDEQYSFVGLGLGLALIITEKVSVRSLVVLVAGATMVWVAHAGRRLMAGELMPYYEQRIPTDLNAWIAKYSWTADSFKTGFQHILVLLPLIFVIRKPVFRYLLTHWKYVVVLGGIFGPLILGRILTGNFGFHYNIVMIAFFICVVCFLLDPERAAKLQFKRMTFSVIVILFMAVLSVGKWKRPLTAQVWGDGLNCKRREVVMSDFRARTESLNTNVERLKTISSVGENWIALSNLTTNLMAELPGRNIFCLCGFEIRNAEFMDGMITERGRFGEFVGFQSELNEKAIAAVRAVPGIEILEDSEDLFVAKGRIPVELFNPLLSPHPVY